MDDFVVWGESGRELRAVCERVRAFLAEELKLALKDNPAINRTAFGMDFLGYRVLPARCGWHGGARCGLRASSGATSGHIARGNGANWFCSSGCRRCWLS